MTQKTSLLLGAHMSAAGGLEKALNRGAAIGCTALQLFTQSNRRWHSKSPSNHEIQQFKRKQNELPIQQVISHASYLINLGTPHSDVHEKSLQAIHNELNRCRTLA